MVRLNSPRILQPRVRPFGRYQMILSRDRPCLPGQIINALHNQRRRQTASGAADRVSAPDGEQYRRTSTSSPEADFVKGRPLGSTPRKAVNDKNLRFPKDILTKPAPSGKAGVGSWFWSWTIAPESVKTFNQGGIKSNNQKLGGGQSFRLTPMHQTRSSPPAAPSRPANLSNLRLSGRIA